MADGDLGGLGVFVRQLDELLAAFGIKLRQPKVDQPAPVALGIAPGTEAGIRTGNEGRGATATARSSSQSNSSLRPSK